MSYAVPRRALRWLRGRHRWWTVVLLAGVIGIGSAWAAFDLTPPATVRMGIASAQIRAVPGSGTVVRATEGRPVTDATLTSGPLQLQVAVALHPNAAVHEPEVLASLDGARPELLHAALTYLLRVAAAAAIAGALLALLLLGPRWRVVTAAGVASVLVVGGSAAATAGSLRAAQVDVASCSHGWSRYALGDLSALTPPAPTVKAPAAALAPANPGLVPVLLIADNHLNPEGLKFALAVQRSTGARAVLDAGDTTSYGVAGEDCLVTPTIRSFPVPYVWVRGNHDGPQFAATMRHVPGVRVLDGGSTQVAGLTVWGIADPSYTAHRNPTTAAMHAADAQLRDTLPARFASMSTVPDVVLVHDCLMAESGDPTNAGAAGIAPLIACGHLHRYLAGTVDGTTVLHTGTVGGGGIAALSTGELRDFGALLLYFDPTTHRLAKWFVVDGPGGGQASFTEHDLPVPRVPSRPVTP